MFINLKRGSIKSNQAEWMGNDPTTFGRHGAHRHTLRVPPALRTSQTPEQEPLVHAVEQTCGARKAP